MRRKLYSAILVVLLAGGLVAGLLQPALSQAAFDLTVYPAKLELQVAAGTGLDLGIHIRNTGGESQTMRIYFNDYSIRPNNDFIFEPPGHYSYSCAKWLQSEKTSIVVPVGQTVSTGFRVDVPANAEPGGHYGVVFFEQVPQPSEAKANIKALPRIGALILVTVPGQIIREGEIKNVSITSTWFWPARRLPVLPRRKVRARIVFYNSGNVHLTVKGSLAYKASFGWGSGKVDFQEITVLPKTTRYLETDIPDPPLIGSYKINAKVEYGPSLDVFDTTKVSTGSFSEYPLSLLLILVAVLALIAIPVTVHYCRKKSPEELGKPDEEKEEKAKAEGVKEESPGEESEAEEKGEVKPDDSAGEPAGPAGQSSEATSTDKNSQHKFLRSLAGEAGLDGGGAKEEEEGQEKSAEDEGAAGETTDSKDKDEAESDEKSAGKGALKPSKRWFRVRRK